MSDETMELAATRGDDGFIEQVEEGLRCLS